MLIRFTKLFSNLTTLEKNVTKLFILKIELFSSPGPNPIKLTNNFYNDKCAFVIFLFTFQQAVKLSTLRSFLCYFRGVFSFIGLTPGRKMQKKTLKVFWLFYAYCFHVYHFYLGVSFQVNSFRFLAHFYLTHHFLYFVFEGLIYFLIRVYFQSKFEKNVSRVSSFLRGSDWPDFTSLYTTARASFWANYLKLQF